MPSPPRIVSLNLGSQTIGLAEFQAQPNGGLVLAGYEQREILADPFAEPASQQQITATLRAMMSQLGIKGGPVDYAISAQSVFTRFVKLPSVEEEKIERIITFEAQQNVPFPIEEVVWDYQLVGARAADQMEVVLVAIKTELLEQINASVESAGLKTTTVDVATMALYNAFRFSYREATGCSLLIDIGARTSNLLFIESGKLFSRSVPIGGSTITLAVAKEFNEPFAAAEKRKVQDGFVSLGDACAEATHPDVARVSKLVRNTMTRLHAELARSITFYRSQQQGRAPQRVFFCGATANTRCVREFFEEKLQLPVEFFNPLRNVTIAPSVAAEIAARSAHSLGELVGLALRRTMTCPMQLNLRPANVVRRQRMAQRRPFLILAAACFLLGLLGWSLYFLRATQVEARLADTLEADVGRMRTIENQLLKLGRETAALDAAAVPLLDVINGRGAWLRILEDLNARLPRENIWVVELAPTSAGKIIGEPQASAALKPPPHPAARATTTPPTIDGVFVRGLYLSNPKQQEVVVDYFRNLLGSAIFAVDPNRQAEVIRPSTPTNSEWAYPYELRLKLRQPLPLP